MTPVEAVVRAIEKNINLSLVTGGSERTPIVLPREILDAAARDAIEALAANLTPEMALAAGKVRHGSNAGFERETIYSYSLAIAAAIREGVRG